jgi:hypothetical protein
MFFSPSRVSRPQKVAAPTFQVPSSYTAFPVIGTFEPPTTRSYFTVAWLLVTSLIDLTLAVNPVASGEFCWALMIEANWEPSCSRVTRLAEEVLMLKKVSQLVVIAAVAPAGADPVLVAAGLVAAGEVAGAEEADVADEAGVEVEPLGLLLPQAAAVAASATSAQTPATRVICRREFIQQSSNCPSAGGIPPRSSLTCRPAS